jgi:hypothetical protein
MPRGSDNAAWEGPHALRWAADAEGAAIESMGVNHGCSDGFMPHQFLDRAIVISKLQQVSGQRMATRLATSGFCVCGGGKGMVQGSSHNAGRMMMPALDSFR